MVRAPRRSSGSGPDRGATVHPGSHARLGATIVPGGIDFCVYARHATGVDILLFDDVDDRVPGRVVRLDPRVDRTGPYWHAHVPGLRPGQLYAYAADGPWDPAAGMRFDPDHVLLDPYGRAVATPDGYRRGGGPSADPGAVALKSIAIDPSDYDWEGDQPLERPFRETIIYEAHLAGFTADPSSGVSAGRRGTYAGFAEKIPYLVDLGVTAVELMPIFQFDRLAAPAGLVNYWGYQPISFFAPHQQYASRPGLGSAVDEFRDLVKALHRAGIEVILDVVYNHTAEVGADGPTMCFRGLADGDYYLLGPDGAYVDDSGTGNTLDANGPIVRRLILDSLRYWVQEMHVDGFRFDLAAVLSRDVHGQETPDSPVLWEIDTDPVLAGTKLIAEPWDAGGLYELGRFSGDRWVEWNGRFRDDVRSFLKSDPGRVRDFTQRFLGSPDIYGHKRREPQASVNFVTCHDGFTLNDLVSYNAKHNEANGEDGRDGSDQNLSWDCGVEGPTDDPAVERLRSRQVRNFLTVELLAVGAPMLLMGDEVRRSQGGNNNAYVHDDPTSWFDWTATTDHADLLRFTRGLIHLRRRVASIMDLPPDAGLSDVLRDPSLEWSGVRVGQPDLSDASRSVALTVRADGGAMHLIFNAYWEPLDFDLPDGPSRGMGWRRVVDTSLASPQDIAFSWDETAPVDGRTYRTEARSIAVLVARGPR